MCPEYDALREFLLTAFAYFTLLIYSENNITDIHVETNQTVLVNDETIKYEKDKLNLKKFDKFLLQQSKSNISI